MDILQGKSNSKVRKFAIDFTLTAAQAEIKKAMRRFTFVRAGRKFGKTKLAERQTLDWLAPPNAVHWHVAPTYRQAKLISWDAFKRLIPQEALSKKPNDSELNIVLKNNAQLYLMGSDEPDSLRGPAPTSMTLEEAAYQKSGVWSDILRPNLTVHRAPALFISSPNGFNWFKDLEDEALQDIERLGALSEWAVFHKTIYDNPYIDREEIESIKRSCDPRVWSQEYMANYESSVGRVFFEFQDTPRHVQNLPLPTKNDSCHRAIDWGLRDDCGVLWGKLMGYGPTAKLFVYRENADNGLSPEAQAQIIQNRTPAQETIESNIIGHDAAKQDVSVQGLTVQWHFTNSGIRPLKLSSRNKSGSRAALQSLISQDRLVIHPECRKLRKQLLAYSWKNTVDEKTMKPDDGNDDLVDALHYLVESLQYRMFLGGRVSEEKTIEEIYKEIREEKKQKSVNRYKLVDDRASHQFDTTGTPAGYL